MCSNVFAVCQHSFIDEPRGFSRPDGLRVNMMIARSLCLVALDALFTCYCPCVSYELSQLMLAIHCWVRHFIYRAMQLTSKNSTFYTVSQKTAKLFLSELPLILVIFGRKIANWLTWCEVYSFSASPNLCHHTTVLNADVPSCYTALKVVSIKLLTFASSVWGRESRDLISLWD